MKALENRTLDSKREMEILDALDEIRLRNARSERVNMEEVLERFSNVDKDAVRERLEQEQQEDEQHATEAFQSADGERVRKLADGEEPDVFSLVSSTRTTPSFKAPTLQNGAAKRKAEQQNFGIAIKRKTTEAPKSTQSPAKPAASSGLSMLASYADDSDSDSSS